MNMSRELCAAASASEAVIMRDDSSAYLAGGTELLRSGTERSADRLIMLKNIPELKGVSGETPEAVRIGAPFASRVAIPRFYGSVPLRRFWTRSNCGWSAPDT